MRAYLRFFALLTVSTLASADTSINLPTPVAATAGTYARDLYEGLFGSWANGPWTQVVGNTSLLGSLFLIYNTFLFGIAVIWSTFSMVGATVQTAHEGELFGKRFSTVWLPIRMVTGMAMLVPVFLGYSSSQSVMMSGTLMGNSVADAGYSNIIAQMAAGTALVAPAAGAVQAVGAPGGADTLVENMFVASACVHYRNAMSLGLFPQTYRRSVSANDATTTIIYGDERPTGFWPDASCGKITIAKKASTAHTTSNAIDYSGIATQTYQATVATTQSFAAQVDAIAQQWVAAVTANGSFQPDQIVKAPLPDLQPLKTQFVAQLATARQQAFSTGLPAITQDAQSNMRRGGWMSAGAYYQTIAMETDAVREATAGVFGFTPPYSVNDSFQTDLQAAMVRTHDSANPAMPSNVGTSAEAGIICKALKSITGVSATTVTGNCSIGQSITGYLINFVSTSGGGAFGMGSVQTINPILSLKTLGDYLMSLGEAFHATAWLTDSAGWLLQKAGTVTKAVGMFTGMEGVAAAGQAAESTGQITSMLEKLSMPTILLGVIMAVYVPLIPFISWFGALISYSTIVVEAIAAAPLWAMAHLDPVGDGMGPRTQHGYLFLLNVLLRPILMLIGFIAASALLIILGSILYAMFMPAVANMQGDSVTGVISIIALLAVYLVLTLTLIQGCMNLLWLVPDQTLSWLGQIGQSQLGKDAEHKIYAMVLAGGAAAARFMAPSPGGAGKDPKEKGKGK